MDARHTNQKGKTMHTMMDRNHAGTPTTIARETFRTEDDCPVVTVVELRHIEGSAVADVYVTTYAETMERNGWWSQPEARAMRRMVAEVAATQGMTLVHGLARQPSNFRALHIPHVMTSMTVGTSYRYVASI